MQGAIPVEVDDELIPDEITIEDTNLVVETAPEAPAVMFAPDSGADNIEDEVFEYYAVEEPPKRINVVSPVYPEMAERAGLKGTVVLKVLVNTIGAVDSVEVVEGPEIFHKASVTAAHKTKFTPARHNDRPVSCWIIMPFRFVFDNN
jgi:protein TonB